MDWGSVPDWVSTFASIATLVIAVRAFNSWRDQLKGSSEYSTAGEVAIAAKALRYAFYGSRSPMYWAWEFPEHYHEHQRQGTIGNREEADAYHHIYNNRWKQLWPSIHTIAELRPKAGAILGDDVANAIEELAKKARELQFLMERHVEHKRAGDEIVKAWTDQKFVQRVEKSVVTFDQKDELSVEFDEKLKSLLLLMKPYVGDKLAAR